MSRLRGLLPPVVLLLATVIAAVAIGLLPRSSVAHGRSSVAHGHPATLVTRRLVGLRQPSWLAMPARPQARWLRIPVLMYHRVVTPGPGRGIARDFNVSPAMFDAQMNWLQHRGYQPISEARLFRALALGEALPSRPVLLTFDDGYVDAVHAVRRALITAKRHWPATFFVITSRIGKGRFLTWANLHLLETLGMDIGSHTVLHIPLALLSPAARAYELDRSMQTLTRGLGHPVYWFAYPYGSASPAAEAAVAHAGYLLAYTTQPSSWLNIDGRTALPRIMVAGSESLAQFASSVTLASGG
jgi:peptidoglycan/xylan/chitin deacetylase (PgdA/CDA1 family)